MGNDGKSSRSLQGAAGTAGFSSAAGYSQVRAPQPYRADDNAAGKVVDDPTKGYNAQTHQAWTPAQYQAQVEVRVTKLKLSYMYAWLVYLYVNSTLLNSMSNFDWVF